MELGELVEVLIPDQMATIECPFSHEKPKPKGKNSLGGTGTRLAKKMNTGMGIHLKAPPVGRSFKKGEIDKDPRKRPDPVESVTITVNGKEIEFENGIPLEYPLTCGAHHLIPAQEALKEHPILKFMCKKGEKQNFRKGGKTAWATVPDSKVWGNVLYDVNGCQNGVWLPGSYAVGGGKGGIDAWVDKYDATKDENMAKRISNWKNKIDLSEVEWAARTDPQEEDEPRNPGTAFKTRFQTEYVLEGENYSINNSNPKWAYVKAAVDKMHAYFHDRHEPYSKEVRKYLRKISEKYEEMYNNSKNSRNSCKKCEDAERPNGASPSLVGPPYGIVDRLERCSNWFKQHLIGKDVKSYSGKRRSAINIYTSKWIYAWMEAEKKARSATSRRN